MFKKTKEFKKIKTELEDIEALDKWAVFQCYGESIATFLYRQDSAYHEFNIISDNCFLSKMKISKLFDLSGITYFGHRFLLESEDGKKETISYTDWAKPKRLKCMMDDEDANCDCDLNHCLKNGW